MAKRKALSQKTRFEVFKRDKFTCQYCGAKAPHVRLEVDHRLPVCEGGGDEMENLAAACWGCNAGKSGNRMPRMISEDDLMSTGWPILLHIVARGLKDGLPWWWVVEEFVDRVTEDVDRDRSYKRFVRATAEARANGYDPAFALMDLDQLYDISIDAWRQKVSETNYGPDVAEWLMSYRALRVLQ